MTEQFFLKMSTKGATAQKGPEMMKGVFIEARIESFSATQRMA